jgi:ribosomal protein S6
MRNYELLMIVNPELSDDDRKTLLAQVTSELESSSIKITKQDDW